MAVLQVVLLKLLLVLVYVVEVHEHKNAMCARENGGGYEGVAVHMSCIIEE